MKQWYVVQARAGYEKKVCLTLQQRIEESQLQPSFGRVLVPTEEVVEMRNGKQRKSEHNLFSGYVLVEMEMNDDSWHLVQSVPKVLRFLGGSNNNPPAPLSKQEVDNIMARINTADGPRPKTVFNIGETVRVSDGPFNDFNGVVEMVNYEKNRIRVSVSIFGRSTPVELDFSQVEKI